MMVIFVSQCEKNALAKTRRVLDSFANRIGDRTWQTLITNAGLDAVKKLLRKTASKNTAVSCHWLRGSSRSDLVWIVGNRKKFNEQGIIPISSTASNVINTEWENQWHYMPLIKALTALAALLHDWGKASVVFQNKLKSKNAPPDPLRHEWVSCVLLCAFIGQDKTDADWLERLALGQINDKNMLSGLKKIIQGEDYNSFNNLPEVASLLIWLILTHHRLPKTQEQNFGSCKNLADIFEYIDKNWGYANPGDEEKCLKFKEGFLSNSSEWLKQVKKWSGKLLDCLPLARKSLEDGTWRLVLHFSRLSLMLGDHNYSSQPANSKWPSQTKLYANTDRKSHTDRGPRALKQKLDEHLVNVKEKALQVAHLLPFLENEMGYAYDIRFLKTKSPPGFEWQDKAVDKIKELRIQEQNQGFFIVNMASTGCGKTIANAKIMRSLSRDNDGLRYILALGLRSLTLQTGDEYRNKIGLDNSNLAVLIGSQAVRELHEEKNLNLQSDMNLSDDEFIGSESLESLFDEILDYDDNPILNDKLSTILAKRKHKQFLYAPVLVCTIDHLMPATENTKGGRYILPALRLMSSDLVLDEVDDFDGNDLIAIGRLIHLAAMLGRKVMISSATIPPSMAEGYFNVYRKGWETFSKSRGGVVSANVSCAFVDEFTTDVETIVNNNSINQYKELHNKFITKRVKNLQNEKLTLAKRKGEIIPCSKLEEVNDDRTIEQVFFEDIKKAIIDKHSEHHTVDISGKKISFGLVRLANINPCVNLAKYLINKAIWSDNLDVKIMAYHSQQVLLLRHEQEKHLDAILKRKEKTGQMPIAFQNEIIRQHISSTPQENIAFILVATPIEEVGRDHDFDWAVVEPSSFRSIVQLAGRIIRHRNKVPRLPNIALMERNLEALKGRSPAYHYPGYEGYQPKDKTALRLGTYSLNDLIQTCNIGKAINAIPRILENKELNPAQSLIDLEHAVIRELLANYDAAGPDTMQGWLSDSWWLTAMPQVCIRFRDKQPSINLYRIMNKEDRYVFAEKDKQGEPVFITKELKIYEDTQIYPQDRLWLKRNYCELLEEYSELTGKSIQEIARRYGEMNLQYSFSRNSTDQYLYSDQFGLTKKDKK